MPAKYKLIAEELRSQILSVQTLHSHKLPTEQELCTRYQVSRQTIRQTLSVLENEKLITRRQGSGAYTVPRIEILQNRKIVFMISEENEYTYPGFLSDVQSVLRQKSISMSVLTTQNDINRERELLTQLLEQNISLLLIEGIQSSFSNPNIDLYEKMQLNNTRIIFINHYYPEIRNAFYLRTDDIAGGYLLGNHIITMGIRNPAAILPDFTQNAKERFFGLQTAYRDASLSIPYKNIHWYGEDHINNLRKRRDTGFLTDAVRTYASSCDCFFCYSDEIAYWLIKELSYSGISVPGQISVVSFDNSYLCSLSSPAITSLGLPIHEPGYTLGNMVLDILYEESANNKTLSWQLFSRNSVSSLPTNYF